MGKPSQYEGATLDGYQQQCGPRSALEIWRSPTSATPSVGEASSESEDFTYDPNLTPAEDTEPLDWDAVSGLESAQLQSLQALSSKGVLWIHPSEDYSGIFSLHYGGKVDTDGNCLFSAVKIAMQLPLSPCEVRHCTVKRFIEDCENGLYGEYINSTIRHLYTPDLTTGWGVHFVQDLKVLAKKSDREALDTAIDELVLVGVAREPAAESIYRERCLAIDDAESWAKYMLLSGSYDDEYDIVNIQYTEDGLYHVDENRHGGQAAFGDDIAIECLANEFEREIYVIQAHGTNSMMGNEHCLFFLPHGPREASSIRYPPAFLFMKGTEWSGGGGDHYEPIVSRLSPDQMPKSAALTL